MIKLRYLIRFFSKNSIALQSRDGCKTFQIVADIFLTVFIVLLFENETPTLVGTIWTTFTACFSTELNKKTRIK